jgi:hypothetical protein
MTAVAEDLILEGAACGSSQASRDLSCWQRVGGVQVVALLRLGVKVLVSILLYNDHTSRIETVPPKVKRGPQREPETKRN